MSWYVWLGILGSIASIIGLIIFSPKIYLYLTNLFNALVNLTKFTKYGIKKVHESFDFKKLFDEVEEELKILDTYIPSIELFLPNLAKALERGIKVKILVVNPDSQVTEFRSKELGLEYQIGRFKQGINEYIEMICLKADQLGVEAKKNIELRCFSDLPCLPMYILKNRHKSNKVFFSFFLGKESVNYLHFEVADKKNGLLRDFEEYFDAKWKRNEKGAIDLKKRGCPKFLD